MEDNLTSIVQNDKILSNHNYVNTDGQPFDFGKMAAVDWDYVHDGQKLILREYTSWNALNILRLSLAMWIIAGHLAIVVFVLSKKNLRTESKNLLIVNVALTHMVMGGLIVPVKLHFILNPGMINCTFAMVWTFLTEYYQSSLSLYAVVCLVCERFIYIYKEKHKNIFLLNTNKLITVILLLLPWVLPLLTLLPTFQAAILAKSYEEDKSNCLFKVDDNYFFASHLLAIVPPFILVVLLAPFTGLLDCLQPNRCSYKPLTPKGESLAVTAFVSFCSIFAEAPFTIVRLLMLKMECNNTFCSRFSEALTMTMWIRISKAAIFPFIWLAYTDIRAAILCKLRSSSEDEYDDEEDELDEGKDTQKFPMTHSNVPDL